MSENAIQFDHVRKRFKKRYALQDFSLSLPQGSATAFIGPNGAGKTTAIKTLLGMHTPDAGKASVMGCESTKLSAAAFREIGYVSENQQQPLWLTVEQFLAYCRPLYPTWDRDLEASLLRQFQLPLQQKLKHLSRGQVMKAALLTNLAFRPKLLVLDEPFSGLDPLARDEFIHGLLSLTESEGWTLFISSHDIEEVARLVDSVALIQQGKTTLHEPVATLQARFRQVSLLLPEKPADELAAFKTNLPDACWEVAQSGRLLHFLHTAWEDAETAPQLLANLPGAHIAQESPLSLREIVVALSREGQSLQA